MIVVPQPAPWPDSVTRASHGLINNCRIRAKLQGLESVEEILTRVEERLGSQLRPRPKLEAWERLELIRRQLALDSGVTIDSEVRATICGELAEIIEEMILERQLTLMNEEEE